MLVDGYLNLPLSKDAGHPIYSVREHENVLGTRDAVLLKDVKMTVHAAMQKKIMAGYMKKVHAWLTGYLIEKEPRGVEWTRIRYDPKKGQIRHRSR